ncbi:hypothetical protein ACFZAD_24615 [Streptomyces iakyrus]|uniref:hypothetical protein n=1 Tax=Streptomyces iakyrus TaxID=68219 RepID=UPI0036EB26C1
MSGLNIVAKRKVSLAEFAEGWDDCYVMVRAASSKEKAELDEKVDSYNLELRELREEKDENARDAKARKLEEKLHQFQRECAISLIESGVVMSTNEDGTTESVEFGESDIPYVVDALGFAWIAEILGVSTGADRLKAMMTY